MYVELTDKQSDFRLKEEKEFSTNGIYAWITRFESVEPVTPEDQTEAQKHSTDVCDLVG